MGDEVRTASQSDMQNDDVLLRYGRTSPSALRSNDNKTEQSSEHLLIKVPKLHELFDIHGKIGEGTFSSVFLATLRKSQRRRFAIKYLVPTSHPSRVQRELRYLKEIGGSNNVIGIHFCLRHEDNIAFIMPYVPHQRFVDYYRKMDAIETAAYIRNLLTALQRVHSFGVIHRDVKPSNFLYNRENKIYQLVDFGLAQDLPCMNTTPSENLKKRKRTDDDQDSTPALVKRVAMHKTDSSLRKIQSSSAITLSQNKENLKNDRTEHGSHIFRSPFKSPFKDHNIRTTPVVDNNFIEDFAMKKSPYKFFNGTPNSNSEVVSLAEKMRPAVRKLFANEDDDKTATKFLMPSSKNITQLRSIQSPNNLNKIDKSKISTPNSIKLCYCFGKPQVCNICLLKKSQRAPRAGTPGYRAPEVLLKSLKQTAAIDIWAVGVIFISILTGCFPFFKALDDISALAELVTLFGNSRIIQVARKLGQNLICSDIRKPIDLKVVCTSLRLPEMHEFPDSAYNLLNLLLEPDQDKRITAEQALMHPYLL